MHVDQIPHWQLIFKPLYGFSALFYINASLGKEVSSQYDVISSLVIVDYSFLLFDPLAFVELGLANITKDDHLIADIGSINGVDLFGLFYLKWLAMPR